MATNAYRDGNNIPTIIAVLNTDGITVERVLANPSNNCLKVSDGTSGGVLTLAASYSESNVDGYGDVEAGGNLFRGQSFLNANQLTLASVSFFIKKLGSPTGNVNAYIYAMMGTLGADGKPTGSALATSAALDISTLTTSGQLISFAFSGTNAIALSAATNYVAAIGFSGGNISNALEVGWDTSSPTASGNYSYSSDGTNWTGASFNDHAFYVYGYAQVNYPNNNARRDENHVPCLIAVSSADGKTPIALITDSSGKLLIQST